VNIASEPDLRVKRMALEERREAMDALRSGFLRAARP
jgi:hypothetical protein